MELRVAQTTNENVKKVISDFFKVWATGSVMYLGGGLISNVFRESKT